MSILRTRQIGLLSAAFLLVFTSIGAAADSTMDTMPMSQSITLHDATIRDNLPILVPEELVASERVYRYEFSENIPAVSFELSSSSNMKLLIRQNGIPSPNEYDCVSDMVSGKASCSINHNGGIVYVKVVPVDKISNGAILTSRFETETENHNLRIASNLH